MTDTEHNDGVICDGENHYDSNGRWIESCPETGTWPPEEKSLD